MEADRQSKGLGLSFAWNHSFSRYRSRVRLKLIAELQPAWELIPGVPGADRPRPASLLLH